MPKASKLFKDMTVRVKRLKSKYMARQLRNEANTPLTYMHDPINIAAYKLLVHAEIEEYIETKASESIRCIRDDVNANGFKNSKMMEVMAIAHHLNITLSVDKPFDEDDFKGSINRILKAAESRIKENNGIKKDSFIELAIFCGQGKDSIDPILLSDLNAYGKSRGGFAHKGVRHTTNFLAPSGEVGETEKILSRLKKHYYDS